MQSRVSFTPVISETYYIAVDGYDGEVGSVVLNFGPPPPTITISGIVKLPNAEVAPIGGLNVFVDVFDNVNNIFNSEFITIAAGTNSAAYDVSVFVASNDDLVVSYFCVSCEDYIFLGYYNNSATSFDFFQATVLTDASDHSNIDLTLLSGDVISGTISLPGSSVAPTDGLSFNISATDSVNSAYGQAVTTFFFSTGESSLNYKFTVPAFGDSEWRLQYFCFECSDDGYIERGYYTVSGTVEDSADATLLDGGMDNLNKDLTFIRDNDELCVPIKATNGKVVLICL